MEMRSVNTPEHVTFRRIKLRWLNLVAGVLHDTSSLRQWPWCLNLVFLMRVFPLVPPKLTYGPPY
jgi:hypothetical protein